MCLNTVTIPTYKAVYAGTVLAHKMLYECMVPT